MEEPFIHFLTDSTLWLYGHAPRLTAEVGRREGFSQVYSLSMAYNYNELLCDVMLQDTGLPALNMSAREAAMTAENWPGPRAPKGESSFPFPTQRRVLRRDTDCKTSLKMVEEWFEQCGIRLGPLVPPGIREDIIRTFWTYCDLNASSILDIPATDLYVHRPRLKDGVKPWSRSPWKRLTEPQRYWLNRLVREGMDASIYELCLTVNGSLSDWNAEPVLVVKSETDA